MTFCKFASVMFAVVCQGAAAGPIAGGTVSKAAFENWLAVWRATYHDNDGSLPEPIASSLPAALRSVQTKMVVSSGGAAGGVVTEGMGYGIMVEAFKAAAGDKTALTNGLGLMKGWLGMVYGPNETVHPFGGGNGQASSATDVDVWPYGVSAITSGDTVPSGVAAWKFPIEQCAGNCQGSATDGDEDAVLGMVYLTAALGYPADLVDVVMRAVISFASADLGFPDMYRTLQDGSRVFVARGGSQWGGLMPSTGKFKSSQEPWCYNPSYFAPGHYRVFRDFATNHWQSRFDAYLPPYLNGSPTSLTALTNAFNGAVTAGYNILYHSSCSSGAVSNWVGVKAECSSDDDLSCAGVPWVTTPYVGASGTCTASGTTFGSWGPDASRTPWRIAMDYVLYSEESANSTMYNTGGKVDTGIVFNAQVYLNRFAKQFKQYADCDGGKPGSCASYQIAKAFTGDAPGLTCPNVPNAAQSWWAAFMAYPTFTGFVAPLDGLTSSENSAWMDTFASICDFSGGAPSGAICSTSYFEAGQEVISAMVMAGVVVPLTAGPSPSLSKTFVV